MYWNVLKHSEKTTFESCNSLEEPGKKKGSFDF